MFDYINSHYGLKVKKGDRVKMQGKPGTITGAGNMYLLIMFDGEKKSLPCHPTWEMEFLD